MKRKVLSLIVPALMIALMLLASLSSSAQTWKFAVMSDTQWPTSPDSLNPNSDAINVINHLNDEFVKKGVKFVIAVGDVTDNGSTLALDTRVTFAQKLYDNGIGFYPLRGNHENSAAGAQEFQRIFPQTGFGTAGLNNLTPANAFITTPFYGVPAPVTTLPFSVGDNFASYNSAFTGLFYSFDYNNARFVLVDQFIGTDGSNSGQLVTSDMANWVGTRLSGRPVNGHAFVFAHKGIITENHADTMFGSSPSANPSVANAFMSNLAANGVRYFMGGHDHMHNRAIVTSPDKASKVMNIIAASDSYKFYIPSNPTLDSKYDVPAFGFLREQPISQELSTVGYYIFTVDGPRVTVDFYSTTNNGSSSLFGADLTNDTINYDGLTKRETFGYSLNGKEFLVGQGQPYTTITDTFGTTTATVLDGTNGSTMVDYNGRALTKDVNTGWTAGDPNALASDILTIWGMVSNLGPCRTAAAVACTPTSVTANSTVYPMPVSSTSDRYVLSLSCDQNPANTTPVLMSKDATGAWTIAANLASGGTPNAVVGPYTPGAPLGTYGYDPNTSTVWAVINYEGDFAVRNLSTPTLTLSSSTNPSVAGKLVAFRATVPDGATGTITFDVDNGMWNIPAPIKGNYAELETSALALGTHTVVATYSGDTNWTAATSAPFTQTVNQATGTISITSVANPTNLGQLAVFRATVPDYATGTVTFDVDNGLFSIPSPVVNGTAELDTSELSGGTHTVVATYSGDASYSAATSAPYTQTVNKATGTISLSSVTNPTNLGQLAVFRATVPLGATGTVTFDVDNGLFSIPSPVSSGTAELDTSELSSGTHIVVATYSGDASYTAATSTPYTHNVN